jgi:hypothetical protein
VLGGDFGQRIGLELVDDVAGVFELGLALDEMDFAQQQRTQQTELKQISISFQNGFFDGSNDLVDSWQLEDEKLPRFGRADVVGVVELAAAIKRVGCQHRPIWQRQRQISADQNNVVAARRAADAVENQIGSSHIVSSKPRFWAADYQDEIGAAIGGLPAYG